MKFQNTLLIACIICCVSCNKSDPSGTSTNNNGPLLKTYVQLNESSLADTLFDILYTYDNTNRIKTRYTHNRYFLLQGGIFQYNYDSTVFLYNGTDKLPYQIKDYYFDVYKNPMTIKNTYYTYNANGLLILDSSYFQFYGSYEKLVSVYRYNLDTIYTTNRFNFYDGSYKAQNIKSRIVVCAENICNQFDTLYSATNSLIGTRKIKVTVNGDPNPFYATKMQVPIWNYGAFKYPSNDFGFFRNNITSIDYSGDSAFGSDSYTSDYTYTTVNSKTKISFNKAERPSPGLTSRFIAYLDYY